jgi:hypothetical protein
LLIKFCKSSQVDDKDNITSLIDSTRETLNNFDNIKWVSDIFDKREIGSSSWNISSL